MACPVPIRKKLKTKDDLEDGNISHQFQLDLERMYKTKKRQRREDAPQATSRLSFFYYNVESAF